MFSDGDRCAADSRPPGGSGHMFDAIAKRYDFLNRVLSAGRDQRWREQVVDRLELAPGARVLDLATGTGDLALAVLARQPEARVWGLDPSLGMLAVAKRKTGREHDLRLVGGDAQCLPFAAGMFDAVVMAFGIRNVPERAIALAEVRRVMSAGGRLVILELTEPRDGVLSPAARFHIHKVVPRLGAALSGAREYRYLEESIARFPSPDAFCDVMREEHYESVEAIPLTFGVCHLFVGEVPSNGSRGLRP